MSEFSFFVNIVRTNRLINNNFFIRIINDKIYVGIVNRHFFAKFATDLIDIRIQFLFNVLKNEKTY